MKAGAFSDEKVVSLSKGLVPIYIDLTDSKNSATNNVAKQYGVSPIPDVRFLKSDATPISKLGGRSANSVASQMMKAIDASK